MNNFNLNQYIKLYLERISTGQMIVIPLLLLFLSLIVLGWSFYTTGSPVELGVEFTGGTVVVVRSTSPHEVLLQEFTTNLKDTPPLNARDAGGGSVMLQFGIMDESRQTELVEYLKSNYGEDFSLKQKLNSRE